MSHSRESIQEFDAQESFSKSGKTASRTTSLLLDSFFSLDLDQVTQSWLSLQDKVVQIQRLEFLQPQKVYRCRVYGWFGEDAPSREEIRKEVGELGERGTCGSSDCLVSFSKADPVE
ncbi:hypothetical protein L484_000020 [Morus notabilis]|uniref:Uncharacterized protein n=1 Tax=Morus notabilis TaxID=981085 RepID=W9RR79_9ROSA|nr:hypothetical protein L484_000883 [Morus notabilis]EXB65815.1 hypothetical protein L484_004774 [Morus notabilis]EXC61903.1 hypothetical protein L484_000020 [Morus notabilis]